MTDEISVLPINWNQERQGTLMVCHGVEIDYINSFFEFIDKVSQAQGSTLAHTIAVCDEKNSVSKSFSRIKNKLISFFDSWTNDNCNHLSYEIYDGEWKKSKNEFSLSLNFENKDKNYIAFFSRDIFISEQFEESFFSIFDFDYGYLTNYPAGDSNPLGYAAGISYSRKGEHITLNRSQSKRIASFRKSLNDNHNVFQNGYIREIYLKNYINETQYKTICTINKNNTLFSFNKFNEKLFVLHLIKEDILISTREQLEDSGFILSSNKWGQCKLCDK